MYRVIKSSYDPNLVDRLVEYYFYADRFLTLADIHDEVECDYNYDIADQVVEALRKSDKIFPED